MKKYLQIHPSDTVAVALEPIYAGEQAVFGEKTVVICEDIPQGHKFALVPISAHSQIIKYGNPIGTAVSEIRPGQWVHAHNLKTAISEVSDYEYLPKNSELIESIPHSFQGYRRSDGRAGIRNELWIIPTVGCVNSIATSLAAGSQHLCSENIEAVTAFPHPYGCSQMGDDQEYTRQALKGLILHPNAGGVLVLGLGCENTGIEILKNYLGDFDPERIRFLNTQDCEDEIAEGTVLLASLAEYAASFEREPIPCSELIIGLKCGGSDGLSGITANPVVGIVSDRHISGGGSSILTEVPEMFGAEQLLMNRCTSREVFDRTVRMIQEYKDYYQRYQLPVYENPSPGNKKGGISTLEDKSLGCTQKSGTAPVCDVLEYGQTLQTIGLNLLSAPGNDLVASTALAVSGAQLILFTTGRGTPFASPVPTVKISSNNRLARTKSKWIDFNCGEAAEGVPAELLAAELYEFVIMIASGTRVCSEVSGFHDMAIFKNGVTL